VVCFSCEYGGGGGAPPPPVRSSCVERRLCAPVLKVLGAQRSRKRESESQEVPRNELII